MKKALFYLVSCSNIKESEFESCRGEGRSIMNIALGFSLLGYECHIINNWKIQSAKKIWNNVYIKTHIDKNDEYDIAFTYDDVISLENINCKHKIVMTYAHIEALTKYIKKHNLDINLVYPYKSFYNSKFTCKIIYNNTKYFPLLYPIPSVNVGFIPYNYNPKLPELKIYMFHSMWSGSFSSNSWQYKQILILKFLKSKGYKLKLFVHVENDELAKNCPYSDVNEIQYISNEKVHYDDIINLIKSVDLCITKGAGYDAFGNSMFDIISLGKPCIYIVNGEPRKEHTINFLYEHTNNLIITQEPDDVSWRKLEIIFDNLEIYYDCFRKQMIDNDFNVWKSYAEKFLNDINI